MKKLIKALRKWYKDADCWYQHELMFEAYGEGEFNHAEWWCNHVLYSLTYLWCEYVVGHDIECTGGYCTGDGAADFYECKRCGKTYDHTYF